MTVLPVAQTGRDTPRGNPLTPALVLHRLYPAHSSTITPPTRTRPSFSRYVPSRIERFQTLRSSRGTTSSSGACGWATPRMGWRMDRGASSRSRRSDHPRLDLWRHGHSAEGEPGDLIQRRCVSRVPEARESVRAVAAEAGVIGGQGREGHAEVRAAWFDWRRPITDTRVSRRTRMS